MIRIHVICEGQTEEMFVNEVLAEHFLEQDIVLQPGLVGKPGHKGGNVSFERIFKDVRLRLLGDRSAYCTTLLDFYGLPTKFPGKADAQTKNQHRTKAACVQDAFCLAISDALGDQVMHRFIPYIQMYEFEGLLFSDPTQLAEAIGQSGIASDLIKVRQSFATPEEINDSPNTAPSKRIIKLFSGYEKVIHGTFAAMDIGLELIREECPLFDAWLQRLESLAT